MSTQSSTVPSTASIGPAPRTRRVRPPRGGDTVVEVRGVKKCYGSTQAVRDVSLSVMRGEIFGILGPNGAGKTTTVEMIAGLRQADAGTVHVLGTDSQRDPAAIRGVLGVQLQEAGLPPKLTVAEALRLYAAFYPEPADPEELLGLLSLRDKRGTRYADLSGGQKQRLSIALALVGNPQVAILDELTTGLDPQARRDTWDLIERVRDSGVTILLVTHFMDEAQRLCDRLVVIDQGTVVAQGSPAELVRQHVRGRRLRLRLPAGSAIGSTDLTALPSVHQVIEVGEELEVTGGDRLVSSVVAALAERGVEPEEIRTVVPTLEDVFVDLVGQGAESTRGSAPRPETKEQDR